MSFPSCTKINSIYELNSIPLYRYNTTQQKHQEVPLLLPKNFVNAKPIFCFFVCLLFFLFQKKKYFLPRKILFTSILAPFSSPDSFSPTHDFVRSFSSPLPLPPWRRKWRPIPVFLPGDVHGQRSLAA